MIPWNNGWIYPTSCTRMLIISTSNIIICDHYEDYGMEPQSQDLPRLFMLM